MPSSLIRVLQRHCPDTDSTFPEPEPSQLACLADVLGRLPDPRRVRGRRYRLGSLLALYLVAVSAEQRPWPPSPASPPIPTPTCANNSD
ncbi:hypothetical protein AB0N14_37695 [Streptomyces sp. NPDC051104]|uniref:hypothetical protein n=1 Tax=Streptomyces sp. NPDC051104 TaxID=3155044 RepID=UPI00342D5F9D